MLNMMALCVPWRGLVQIAPNTISYSLLEKNLAKLEEFSVFKTPIFGYSFVYATENRKCRMKQDGTLVVFPGFVWDFASGPAIDTPEVVMASLAHDCLGWLVDNKMINEDCRKKADKLYFNILKEKQVWFIRRWYHYLAVRAYSFWKGLF